MSHIFYKVSPKFMPKLLRELAKEKGSEVRIDKLDCSKSWGRQTTTEKTFEEIIDIALKENAHWVFIHRKPPVPVSIEPEHIEAGVSTLTGISWYIFVFADLKLLDRYIKKYKLKPL